MKKNIMKKEKGAIAIFVLVGLLFMAAFLILLFAGNINQAKDMKEQSDITSQIYAGEGEQGAYGQAFGELRRKNRTTLNAQVTDSKTLPLERSFGGNISNYRIYGNSIQDGTPSPENPVEIQSVGDKTKNLLNIKDYRVQHTDGNDYVGFNVNHLEIGKTYTLSSNKTFYGIKICNSKNGYGSIDTFNENGMLKQTFTMTRNENIPDGSIQYLYFRIDAEKHFATDISQLDGFEIQIEEGEIATDYEPYGYKIPIKISTETSNYTNLFDFKKRTDFEGSLEFGRCIYS